MSTVVPPAFAWGKGGEIFRTLVKERTAGPHQHQAVPGRLAGAGPAGPRVLGDAPGRDRRALRRADQLDLAPCRELGLFTLPFLMPDHKAWDAVIADEALVRDYFEMVRKAGAEPLAMGETGYRQISNSKQP